MASLDDYLAAVPRRKKGPLCSIARLPDPLRAQFDGAPAQTGGADISLWLKSEGYNVSQVTVQRHRRRECACG